ncbi:glycine zipper domain-containing protein [Paracraurococcus lichenis]|uniref:Glycine zipper domain-containing protein n=1 Tax=Paracraurococcus lichenis TaxID=3064888 RepID=A0ABT9EDH7_9PROT|nr:glycine zipper domain-containing protein [Paracraurococcus sp. LOR1-02]MDO9714280.1 glycine zipper domain-containing protein [Paracraurococcus sp. LOR1-02]
MRLRYVLSASLVAAVSLGGCADLTPTQQRTLTGTAAGTAGGALIGAMAGDAGLGALIGAGVGAGGGYLYGASKDNQERAYRQGYMQGRAAQRGI